MRKIYFIAVIFLVIAVSGCNEKNTLTNPDNNQPVQTPLLNGVTLTKLYVSEIVSGENYVVSKFRSRQEQSTCFVVETHGVAEKTTDLSCIETPSKASSSSTELSIPISAETVFRSELDSGENYNIVKLDDRNEKAICFITEVRGVKDITVKISCKEY